MNTSGFTSFTALLFSFLHPTYVWSDGNANKTDFIPGTTRSEILGTSRDLIGDFKRELQTSNEIKQVFGRIINNRYENLSPGEKENLKSRISALLVTYSKLKDLTIHDVRSFIQILRGQQTSDSLVRLIKLNADIFKDVLHEFSNIVRPDNWEYDTNDTEHK